MNIGFSQYPCLMFWIFYFFSQYSHLVFFIFVLLCNTLIVRFRSSIYLCNTNIVHGLTFIHNVNFCFCVFGFRCGCPSPDWHRGCAMGKGRAQICLQHWWVWCILYGHIQLGVAFTSASQCYHGVGLASTREQSPKVQDHTTMNAQVLNNPLA